MHLPVTPSYLLPHRPSVCLHVFLFDSFPLLCANAYSILSRKLVTFQWQPEWSFWSLLKRRTHTATLPKCLDMSFTESRWGPFHTLYKHDPLYVFMLSPCKKSPRSRQSGMRPPFGLQFQFISWSFSLTGCLLVSSSPPPSCPDPLELFVVIQSQKNSSAGYF